VEVGKELRHNSALLSLPQMQAPCIPDLHIDVPTFLPIVMDWLLQIGSLVAKKKLKRLF